MSSSLASGTKSWMRGTAALGTFSQADGSQLGQRTDRLPETPFDSFQSGDKRRRHRTHAGDQDSQFAFGGRNLDVVLIAIQSPLGCIRGKPARGSHRLLQVEML